MSVEILIPISVVLALLVVILRTDKALKKCRKLLSASVENHKSTSREIVDYISKIENRMCTNLEGFNALSLPSYDWAVIISFNRKDLLQTTLETLAEFEPDMKILVIDNGSDYETVNLLMQYKENGKVDRLVLNSHKDVPQWQKNYSLAQALKILSLDNLKSLCIMDNDLRIDKPFLKRAREIVNFRSDFKVVNLMSDDIQENNHPTEEVVMIEGMEVRVKSSFNGAAVYFPIQSIKELGMPPVGEGISYASVEDWYYTRLLMAKKWKVATIDCVTHLGYSNSSRETVQNNSIKNS